MSFLHIFYYITTKNTITRSATRHSTYRCHCIETIVASVSAVLKPVADLLHSFYYDNESYSSLPRNVLDS